MKINHSYMSINGWGGYPKILSKIYYPKNIDEIKEYIQKKNIIARGNGRSYGDSAINEENTIDMRKFNKIISFNKDLGQLVLESGVILSEVIENYLPEGWFPFVTPGSKFVTIGGMIAADVHGKNHHINGSFKNYVDWIEIIDANGKIKICSRDQNQEIFEWSFGTMGLTGIIIKACIKLRPIETAWIKQKTLLAKNIDQAIKIFEETLDSTYSVAWIDCLGDANEIGRSIIYIGEHAKISDLNKEKIHKPLKITKKKKINLKFYFPNWFLSNFFIKLFNKFYFNYMKVNLGQKLVYWDDFFYPLDNILEWNKIYGKRGFIQFQCVLPLEKSKEGILEILGEISKSKISPFLSVLKRFGDQNSKFSFPLKGYTIALDFPKNDKTLELLNRLDEITLRHNGRFYLAKDSRIKKEIFKKSDSRLNNFIDLRTKVGSNKVFRSSQSNRLEI